MGRITQTVIALTLVFGCSPPPYPRPVVLLDRVGDARLSAQCERERGELVLVFELPGTTRCRTDANLDIGGVAVPDLLGPWRDMTRGGFFYLDRSTHIIALTSAQEAALVQTGTVRVSCSGQTTSFTMQSSSVNQLKACASTRNAAASPHQLTVTTQRTHPTGDPRISDVSVRGLASEAECRRYFDLEMMTRPSPEHSMTCTDMRFTPSMTLGGGSCTYHCEISGPM